MIGGFIMEIQEKFYQKTWFIIASLILFWPVGVVLLWVQKKFSLNIRVVVSIIFGLFFVTAITSGDDTTNTASQYNSQSIQQKTEEKTQQKPEQKAKEQNSVKSIENQQLVKNFEKSIYDLENSIKPVMDKYQNDMKNLGKTVSIYDAYSSANNARDAVKILKSKFYTVEIPDSLPEEIKNILEDVRSDLGTAYYSKEQAFEYVLKFLDDQKPSDMQKFKEETALADQFVLSGIAKLMDAKIKVGIDITKEEKAGK